MSRTLANARVTAILREQTSVRTKRSHGVPTEVRVVECVYQLECGHTTSRSLAFNRKRPAVGARLNCTTCAAQLEHPGAHP